MIQVTDAMVEAAREYLLGLMEKPEGPDHVGAINTISEGQDADVEEMPDVLSMAGDFDIRELLQEALGAYTVKVVEWTEEQRKDVVSVLRELIQKASYKDDVIGDAALAIEAMVPNVAQEAHTSPPVGETTQRLVTTLKRVREAILEAPVDVLVDTFWMGYADQTVVDYISGALEAVGAEISPPENGEFDLRGPSDGSTLIWPKHRVGITTYNNGYAELCVIQADPRKAVMRADGDEPLIRATLGAIGTVIGPQNRGQE